ncbi:hypothetical protein DYB32_004904 [Aphanomyces invadans]|uniref:Uncharacterized protein n=1 Tax=Aphanomyces invadans TaxID=157072 RepID=A0A3R6VB07_9STRA|nr:hypothetical protein DYB32_004904 [Aphanomyces invadans]
MGVVVESMDPVLIEDADMLCDTLNQICELEQQQQQHPPKDVSMMSFADDLDVMDWGKADEDRPAEACTSAPFSRVAAVGHGSNDTSKAVEDALYGDDDDDDDGPSTLIKVEIESIQPHGVTDSKDDCGLLSDMPNMLDMLNAMYADQASDPQGHDATTCVDQGPKFTPLSIHIPAPISIPHYQPLQPATVTYQNTKLLAPHSTPNIHFTSPVYFSQLAPPPHREATVKPQPPFARPPPTGLAANALLSPTYQGHVLASRLCCPKAKTPKALPRFTLSPDIAEQKLMRIFFQYCDPATKCLKFPQLLYGRAWMCDSDDSLPRRRNMLTKHRIKEESPMNLSILFPPNETTTTPFPQSLFPSESDTLTLDAFRNAFQICNRCTELKRKQSAAVVTAGDGNPVVVSAFPRDVTDDVAPVLVRVVPLTYEGPKIKSCDHFQWTWCEGFDKTGNEKCNGTNRHDKCPKYLANCTLWKHRLPPKNRKSKGPDEMDSPAKKLKFFS